MNIQGKNQNQEFVAQQGIQDKLTEKIEDRDARRQTLRSQALEICVKIAYSTTIS